MGVKTAERLRKAAMMMAVLEAIDIEIDDESEKSLAKRWTKLLEWLFEHRHEWSLTMQQIIDESNENWATVPGRPLRFLELWNSLKNLEGGRFLNYRILRKGEAVRYKDHGQMVERTTDRYVVQDGTHDIAEVVTESATQEVKWIFTYRSQNLVHLLQAAIHNNIKVIT